MITRYESCLDQFDDENKEIQSTFSDIFEEACDSLDECYKRCLDQPTKDECDEQFQEDLEELCEDDAPTLFVNYCKRKAEKWFDFVQENADDYFEKVQCQPCFMVLREDGGPEAQCITNTVTTDTGCAGDA